jgi:hypothetical protein
LAHPDLVTPADSRVGLVVDVLSAKVLVWIASVGRDAELTRDANLYFADRYSRLARIHRARGRVGRASELDRKAREHLDLSGWDGPPFAAAMGLPRPRHFVMTDAVSRTSLGGPDAAA